MSLVEMNAVLKSERKRVKREGGSKELLKKMEVTASYIAVTIEAMKREGIDPEGGGI